MKIFGNLKTVSKTKTNRLDEQKCIGGSQADLNREVTANVVCHKIKLRQCMNTTKDLFFVVVSFSVVCVCECVCVCARASFTLSRGFTDVQVCLAVKLRQGQMSDKNKKVLTLSGIE